MSRRSSCISLRTLVVVLACAVALLAGAAPAHAAQSVMSPLRSHGSSIGTAAARFAVTTSGWAVVDASVLRFRAPAANKFWQARTVIISGCVDLGYDPERDSGGGHAVAVSSASPWRATRISGTTGTLRVADHIEKCAAGQEPSSSFLLKLQVRQAGRTTLTGSALLFAAG